MENKEKLNVGRPKYKPNKKLLKNLFKQVEDKTITNEQGWILARL